MEEDWFVLFFFFFREIGPFVAVSAGLLKPTFAGRFQLWEGSSAPAGGSHGLVEKTFQPHTFSRCMRREVERQLRGGLPAEIFPTQLLFAVFSQECDFLEWHAAQEYDFLEWHTAHLPVPQPGSKGTFIMVSLQPAVPFSVSRGFSVRVTTRSGVFIPSFPTLGINRTRQFTNSAGLPMLELPCHMCQRMATRCHCPFKDSCPDSWQPWLSLQTAPQQLQTRGHTLQTFIFKPLNVHLSLAPTEWQCQTAQRQQIPPVSHYL